MMLTVAEFTTASMNWIAKRYNLKDFAAALEVVTECHREHDLSIFETTSEENTYIVCVLDNRGLIVR